MNKSFLRISTSFILSLVTLSPGYGSSSSNDYSSVPLSSSSSASISLEEFKILLNNPETIHTVTDYKGSFSEDELMNLIRELASVDNHDNDMGCQSLTALLLNDFLPPVKALEVSLEIYHANYNYKKLHEKVLLHTWGNLTNQDTGFILQKAEDLWGLNSIQCHNLVYLSNQNRRNNYLTRHKQFFDQWSNTVHTDVPFFFKIGAQKFYYDFNWRYQPPQKPLGYFQDFKSLVDAFDIPLPNWAENYFNAPYSREALDFQQIITKYHRMMVNKDPKIEEKFQDFIRVLNENCGAGRITNIREIHFQESVLPILATMDDVTHLIENLSLENYKSGKDQLFPESFVNFKNLMNTLVNSSQFKTWMNTADIGTTGWRLQALLGSVLELDLKEPLYLLHTIARSKEKSQTIHQLADNYHIVEPIMDLNIDTITAMINGITDVDALLFDINKNDAITHMANVVGHPKFQDYFNHPELAMGSKMRVFLKTLYEDNNVPGLIQFLTSIDLNLDNLSDVVRRCYGFRNRDMDVACSLDSLQGRLHDQMTHMAESALDKMCETIKGNESSKNDNEKRHREQYLRTFLGRFVGLEDPTEDPDIDIYNHFLRRQPPAQDYIREFYTHITPKKFMDRIRDQINNGEIFIQNSQENDVIRNDAWLELKRFFQETWAPKHDITISDDDVIDHYENFLAPFFEQLGLFKKCTNPKKIRFADFIDYISEIKGTDEIIDQILINLGSDFSIKSLQLNGKNKGLPFLNKWIILEKICGYSPSLKKIDLSSNEINQYPMALKNLKELRYLNLSDNQLEEFPPEICELKKLHSLKLGENNLKTLSPEIARLQELEVLEVSNNQLEELPPEIGGLQIRYFLLHDNNLRTLPPEIGGLQTLRHLHVSNNQLTELPTEIGKLNNLNFLKLDNNQLKMLPPEIGKLAKLMELDLSGNQLETLPVSMGGLTRLTSLNLAGNENLRTIPVSFVTLYKKSSILIDVTNTSVPYVAENIDCLGLCDLFNLSKTRGILREPSQEEAEALSKMNAQRRDFADNKYNLLEDRSHQAKILHSYRMALEERDNPIN